jgi:GH15 family glucan-1,4-alpha-glucosidase
MAVALDDQLRIRDFFYPNVGLENHLQSHEFKIGFWQDEKFDWIGKKWDISMKYLPETLVSNCLAENQEHNVRLKVHDAVHYSKDIFLEKLQLTI